MKRLLILILILSGAEISAAAIRKAVAATGVVAASKALSLVHADHEPAAPHFGYMKRIEDSFDRVCKIRAYQNPVGYINALDDLRDGVSGFGEVGLPKSIRESVEFKVAMGKYMEYPTFDQSDFTAYLKWGLTNLRRDHTVFLDSWMYGYIASADRVRDYTVFLRQIDRLRGCQIRRVYREFVQPVIGVIGIRNWENPYSFEDQEASIRPFIRRALCDMKQRHDCSCRLKNESFSGVTMFAFSKDGCDFELLKNLRYVCPLNEFNRSENHWDYKVAKRAAQADSSTEVLDYLIANSDDSACRDWVKEALNAVYLVHEVAAPLTGRAVRFVPEAEQRLISRLSLLDYEKPMPRTKLELLRSVHLFDSESSINLSKMRFSKQDLNEMVQHFDLVTSENLTLLVQHGKASCDQICLAIEASVWNRDNKDHMLGALAKVEQAIKNQRSDLQSSVEEPKPKSAWWRHGWLRRI